MLQMLQKMCTTPWLLLPDALVSSTSPLRLAQDRKADGPACVQAFQVLPVCAADNSSLLQAVEKPAHCVAGMALGERASLTVMGLVMLGTLGSVLLVSAWKKEQKALLMGEAEAQMQQQQQQQQQQPRRRSNDPEDRLQELLGRR